LIVSVKTMTDNQPKAAITVSKMCSLLGMSRSQFYWHVKKGTFHAPLRLSNGRPYFNASQVEDNLKARELGIGVNGEYVLFYERTDEPAKPRETPPTKADHTELLASLQTLGLTTVTTKQVGEAVVVCYPKGTCNVDENDILRTVFRHLKRAGVG
jgi:predicted DNA-binding transcriptional regulator AlpA